MQIPVTAAPAALPAQGLERHFLPAIRQRFKSEVNRLTGGAMRALLDDNPDADDLAFLLSYVHAFEWLRHDVHPRYHADVVAPFRKGARAVLMDLLVEAEDVAGFVAAYVDHMVRAPDESLRERQQALRLLAGCGNDPARLTEKVLGIWRGLGLLERSYAESYRDLAREERERYGGMLGSEDRERLALVDRLPDDHGTAAPRFAKLGVIPAMGCPQTCRHCMFIWRPPMRNVPDAGALYELVGGLTDSVLFTGGDLTRHLHHFTRAIREMRPVRTFAILLNGDFADDLPSTEAVLRDIANALGARPRDWPAAQVLLQISFDEFHQEIIAGPDGTLRERIPVAKIANIVESAPRHQGIQLCLVHKQTALNFSMDVFQKGVFGRLVEELGARGHRLRVLAASPSPRFKRNPQSPTQTGQVVKDASFVLEHYPERPILLTSSTIDAYGRAELLDPGEAVNERDLLQKVLAGDTNTAETFDTDLMFWFNGWATLFSAVHVCLGNVYEEGADRVLARHRRDPLTRALRGFDRRLLDYYAEVRGDLDAQIARATSPHHLFHMLTEDPAVRLHMTRRLIEALRIFPEQRNPVPPDGHRAAPSAHPTTATSDSAS